VSHVYREVDPPRRIAYTEVLEAPGTPLYGSLITEMFELRHGGTLLTFQHQGFPTPEERDIHRRGYQIIIERLQTHFATRDRQAEKV
jgi:uncharacterized protein YndB with AHSA1/START domain